MARLQELRRPAGLRNHCAGAAGAHWPRRGRAARYGYLHAAPAAEGER